MSALPTQAEMELVPIFWRTLGYGMRLLLIHGSSAVGKVTVAKAVTQLISCRLFDNHAAIDTALTVFNFGERGFWELVHTVRLSVLDAAAKQHVPLVAMTYCYSDPEDRPAFEQFEKILEQNGGEVLPVYLHCSVDEAIRRVGNPDRIERRKISTENGLRTFVADGNLTAIPRSNCLKLDTEVRSAQQTAQEIARHFRLY